MNRVAWFGIDAGGEPVDHHVEAVLLHVAGLVVVGGERVPVGDEEQARVLLLQAHPVLQHAVVMAEVQAPVGRMPDRTRVSYIARSARITARGSAARIRIAERRSSRRRIEHQQQQQRHVRQARAWRSAEQHVCGRRLVDDAPPSSGEVGSRQQARPGCAPPSSGRIGSRLSTMITTLTTMPAIAIWASDALAELGAAARRSRCCSSSAQHERHHQVRPPGRPRRPTPCALAACAAPSS